MVVKPSEVSPFSATIFTEIMHDAGVFNLGHGDGKGVGEALTSHPEVDLVSFTGSTPAGIQVARNAALTVKRVHQELGGKSPNILLPSADFPSAVAAGVAQIMLNSGQSCNAPSRMLVPFTRTDEVADLARTAAAVGCRTPREQCQNGPGRLRGSVEQDPEPDPGRHRRRCDADNRWSRNIPFALEKPCGINMAQVTRLRELAEQANLYCAVPLIFRMSELLSVLKEAEGRLAADYNYMSFRFIVGPPARYETAGSGWAIDPVFSGGGSTINVATHFIDLFRLLTGKEVSRVSAVMNSLTHRGAVEDYSLLTLQTEDGVIGVVETGYSFPSTADEQREFSFTLSSDHMYAKSGPDRIEIRDRQNLAAGTRSRRLQLDTDVYYPLFVKQVLAECRNGAKPIASLRDAEAIMQVMDAAYASARQGGTLLTLTPTPE